MRLAAIRADPFDLDRVVAEVLDQRLLKGTARPLAVAFSGGGDSMALLLAATAWATAAARPVLALTVDHGLRPESVDWTRFCAEQAARLGAGFRALAWSGPKPATGLPAAARAARHRLLAEAAREAGAGVILMGHTADDVLESRAMRAAGATTPEPRAWAPSPAWPEGRGVFLLRPLLTLRRAPLRDWLSARGEAWIEDPSNADLRYARARARHEGVSQTSPSAVQRPPRALAAACQSDAAGVLRIARGELRAADRAEAAAFLGAACLCAAGGARPPAAARLGRLVTDLAAERAVAASLAGARIEADATEVRILREPGETARGGLAAMALAAGETAVWDGRFEITAEQPMEIRPLAGLAARLPKHQRQALAAYPPKARAALPAAVDGERVTCLALDAGRCRALGHARLRAACGLVEGEPV